MPKRIALRRVFVVSADLVVLEDPQVVLEFEIFHAPQADDFVIVLPRDTVVGVSIFNEERDKFFDRKMCSDSAEEKGLAAAVLDEAKCDHAVAHSGVIWRVVVPHVILNAVHERIGIDHLRMWEFLYERTTIMRRHMFALPRIVPRENTPAQQSAVE